MWWTTRQQNISNNFSPTRVQVATCGATQQKGEHGRTSDTNVQKCIHRVTSHNGHFPIQLWDKLTGQVQDTLNLMRASRVNPTILVYKTLNRPYDWNRYPLAPLGCKATVYEDGNTRGSWTSIGVDGWYLGPSKDHYRCALYLIPKTRAYRTSGSTEFFPQHCQLPCLTPKQNFRALAEEMTEAINMDDIPQQSGP